MTRIMIYKDKSGDTVGFEVKGHAGYAQSGSDIVCAAISILTYTTCNSIETFTNDTFGFEEVEEKAYLKLILNENPSREAKLLLNSMTLGLSDLAKQYSNQFLKLKFKEV